ncbi:MAG: PAS domain S-box protein [Rhodospirillaceae bacterium]|nr:PAS domain S-box protein [Rhodospirillales bacterium]
MTNDTGEDALRRSEADLRAVLDNMTDVFFRTDAQARLIMASRSIEDLLGWPRTELLGRDVRDLYVDLAERDRFLALTDRQGGRATDVDIELRRRDGSTVLLSASARRLSADQGGGLEGTLRDVSHRRIAERKQRESRELVQALLDTTSDAALLIDRSGTLLACNKVFADRFGRAIEDIVGGDLFALFPPDVGEARRAACLQTLATGEAVLLRDSRHGRHFHNSITPVPNPNGPPEQVAVFSRDITEDLAREERLASYVAAMERSNEELEQFAYVASHDLREPLRLVSNYVSLLERRYADQLDQDAREFIGFARNGALRMDALILDLLAYSRVSRGGVALASIPLVAPIESALPNLALAVRDTNATVTVEVDHAITINGDAGQLARMFQNLVGNALKYSAPDRPPCVRITATVENGHVRVAVSDNGIGIEFIYFDRIFRIFQRLHTVDKYDGTGIGLALCKRIAENHGGSISVSSQPGSGSTFTVTLPVG